MTAPITEALTLLARWAEAWGLPELAARTRVEVNPRLRRSLARCRPVAGVIQLSARLLAGDGRPALAEALCHELAHLAVQIRHGVRTAPHGSEWKALMVQAGFAPRARLDLGVDRPAEARQAGLLYDHRCLVCHRSWPTKRPMRAWRCPDCHGTGQDGALEITTRPSARRRP